MRVIFKDADDDLHFVEAADVCIDREANEIIIEALGSIAGEWFCSAKPEPVIVQFYEKDLIEAAERGFLNYSVYDVQFSWRDFEDDSVDGEGVQNMNLFQ